jgi:hypoxanthine phosphoribosyltransferase
MSETAAASAGPFPVPGLTPPTQRTGAKRRIGDVIVTLGFAEREKVEAVGGAERGFLQGLARTHPCGVGVPPALPSRLVGDGHDLLVPLLDVPLQLDYIHATRYRGGTRGHDDLHWKAKPVASLQDRDVLLIDDILDQGVTLQALVRYCQAQGAASVASAVLVRKLRDDAVTGADYIGLDVPDRYVFGCGMDYGEYHRQFPAIYALPEDH